MSYNIVNMLLNFVSRYTAIFPQELERLVNVLSVLWQILIIMPRVWVRSTSPLKVLGGKGRHIVYVGLRKEDD